MGLPVVAVTTDGAAELVSSGCTGHVVASRVAAVAAAVAALLDEARPPRRAGAVADSRPSRADLALRLLEVYGQAVAWPGLWRG
jgi:glycosyltransferase involved in cell wall biosynthesis